MKIISVVFLTFFLMITFSSYSFFVKNVNARYLVYKAPEIKAGQYSGSKIGTHTIYTPGSATYSWSNTYNLETVFCTGFELNEEYNSNYENKRIYAVVKWTNGGNSVVKTEYTIDKEVLMIEDMNNINKITGKDSEGRSWEIWLQ